MKSKLTRSSDWEEWQVHIQALRESSAKNKQRAKEKLKRSVHGVNSAGGQWWEGERKI